MNIRLRTFLVAFTAACLWYNGSVMSSFITNPLLKLSPQIIKIAKIAGAASLFEYSGLSHAILMLDAMKDPAVAAQNTELQKSMSYLIAKNLNSAALYLQQEGKKVFSESQNLIKQCLAQPAAVPQGSFSKLKQATGALCSGIWNKITYPPRALWNGCSNNLGSVGAKIFIGYLLTGYLYAYTIRKSEATNIFNRRTPADQKGQIDNVQGGNLVINLRQGGHVTLDTLFFPMVAWANLWEAAGNNRMCFVGP